jgi:DNA-binding MarR family transcriptional regulator
LVFELLGLDARSKVTALIAKSSDYVNIADLMSVSMSPQAADPALRAIQDDEPMYELIELFFFAYRDFVGDADRLLEAYGFGRAHHRVLYFVTRRPGLTIAELLEILRITKQSLNRVLRELVDKGFIESRAGALDRRRRQLHATVEGERLALRLAQVQTRRFAGALERLGDSGAQTATAFLNSMIDADGRIAAPAPRAGPSRRAGGARRP